MRGLNGLGKISGTIEFNFSINHYFFLNPPFLLKYSLMRIKLIFKSENLINSHYMPLIHFNSILKQSLSKTNYKY